ncbi:hypothetical protein [Cryobacterium sp. Y82]|uniref:hypothetical protein n=1 Tax=Cryobacterium sp. Y82 TaxID=2045017 RepID=UPI0011B09C7B|nr:hypothetical protein [Cryobacterium sp. Y82]
MAGLLYSDLAAAKPRSGLHTTVPESAAARHPLPLARPVLAGSLQSGCCRLSQPAASALDEVV